MGEMIVEGLALLATLHKSIGEGFLVGLELLGSVHFSGYD